MDWTILRASLQTRRTSLAWYSVSLLAYGWLIIAIFPMIRDSGYMEAAMEVWSEDMLAALGGSGLSFGTLGGFLGIEYLSLIWVFIIGAAVIMFAAGALAGSVDDGTMEVTLSQPVSRTTVALTNFAGMAIYGLILNLVTVATIYLPGLIHDVDVPLDAMALLFVAGSLVTLAIGSFAFMISALTTGRGRTIGISLGVLVMMYLADILGNLAEEFEWALHFELFRYWKPGTVIDDLSLPAESWLVFGVATVVFFAAGLYIFQRRDVV